MRDEQLHLILGAPLGVSGKAGRPVKIIMSRIEERANYGETASGRFLAEEFAREPFGWDFEAVRLLVLSLLRAGRGWIL